MTSWERSNRKSLSGMESGDGDAMWIGYRAGLGRTGQARAGQDRAG